MIERSSQRVVVAKGWGFGDLLFSLAPFSWIRFMTEALRGEKIIVNHSGRLGWNAAIRHRVLGFMMTALLASCAGTTVTRDANVKAPTQGDLSGYWNDIDAQMVAKAMIE